MKKLLLLTSVLFSLHVCAQVDVRSIDKYIEKARKDWNVPGMAVAIVKDGKIVLSKGFGVKELGGKDKVDDKTQFAIASNSKAFVASAISRLVDEGKLSWDDKVRDYLPYFGLYSDEYVSSKATIEDLLCHRLGLGTYSGDVIWYKSEKEPEDFIRHAGFVPEAFEFRNGYGYSNLMFITAGEIIAKVTGEPWEKYASENFFEPLNMNNTTLDLSSVTDNVATPHKPTLTNGTIPIEWVSWNKVSAAGGVISCVNDMAQWMMMNLNGGEWNGKRLIDKEQQNRLWTPNNNYYLSERSKESIPGRHFAGYGLGWGLQDYFGTMIVSHGGGYDGMYSRVMMIPDLKLGVVVLTNSMEGISTPLTYYIANQYLKKDMRDWSGEYLQRARARNGHKDQVEERVKSRVQGTTPSLAVGQITGTYYDPMYGEIKVNQQADKLRLSFEKAPLLGASLEHWHYDVYEIKWDREHAWFDFGTISFETDNNARVIGIEFDVPNYDIFFHEIHAKRIKE